MPSVRVAFAGPLACRTAFCGRLVAWPGKLYHLLVFPQTVDKDSEPVSTCSSGLQRINPREGLGPSGPVCRLLTFLASFSLLGPGALSLLTGHTG